MFFVVFGPAAAHGRGNISETENGENQRLTQKGFYLPMIFYQDALRIIKKINSKKGIHPPMLSSVVSLE